MKSLFKISLLLLVLTTALQNSFSQITKQDAIDLVIDTLFVDEIDSVSIFMDSTLLTNSYFKLTVFDSIQSPYSEYWLFFIDKEPWAFHWGHNCSYLFVNKANGLHTEVEGQIPIFQYYTQLEHISVTFELIGFSHDFSGGPLSYSYPEDNEHLFAVIFAVAGTDKDQFIPVVWNNVAHTFAALKNNGFADDNIYILFNDGSPDGIGTHFPKLDLNNDEEHDILENVVCNKDNLEDIFDNLKEVMDDDDLLFMYSYTHGYKIDHFHNKTKLGLWNDEIYDSELSSIVEQVNCSEFIYINEACHGGGLVDDFTGIHQTVVTPVEWGVSIINPSDEIKELGYTPYTYALVTAMRGEHPLNLNKPWESGYSIGNHPTLSDFKLFDHLDGDFNPDLESYGNFDGKIQMNETIEYGKVLDQYFFGTHGLHFYNSGFNETDDLLSLTGLSGAIKTTQSVEGNFLIGGDLSLSQGTTLTIDGNSKFFFANGDFTTSQGSQLNLSNDISFANLQTQSSFDFVGGLTFGPGGSFNSNENTTLKIRLVNQLLQANINNNTFVNCEIHSYAATLDVVNSTFEDCGMVNSYMGGIDLDNCQFVNSGLYLENGGLDTDVVSVNDCSFSTITNLLGISLWSYDYFTVADNTFSDYYDGIQVMQTGQGIPTFRTISGNTIKNSTNAGIVTFNSGVNIVENIIEDNNDGIRVLNNSTVSIQGNPSATNYSEMNLIQNNDRYEVYSSTGSFPWYFRYNAIFDEDNNGNPDDPHIYYQPSGAMQTLDVSYNCWDSEFYANQDLYPATSYDTSPEWCPPGGHKSSDIVLQTYLAGLEHFENEEFTDARETFEEVIEQYPQTQYAPAAMKELLAVEKVDGNNFTQLQQYYNTSDSIQFHPDLEKLAGYLSNQCEMEMENWQTAIDYFEDIIENPDSPEDSIFAIIDLGYTYFLIENSGQKSTAKGALLQHIPVSMQSFTAKRDSLLAMLPFAKRTEKTNDDLNSEKMGELSQNVPNPFRGSTQISYKLRDESNVELNIYCYSGQLIKTINEGRKAQGTHIINFNASGFRSGIYFYSISVNGQITDSKKMSVIN